METTTSTAWSDQRNHISVNSSQGSRSRTSNVMNCLSSKTRVRAGYPGMPFVAFDYTSKTNKKLVRVQAAKASAEARKATISHKRVLLKKARNTKDAVAEAPLSSTLTGKITSPRGGEDNKTSPSFGSPEPSNIPLGQYSLSKYEEELCTLQEHLEQAIWIATHAIPVLPRICLDAAPCSKSSKHAIPVLPRICLDAAPCSNSSNGGTQDRFTSEVERSRAERDIIRIIRIHAPGPTNSGPELIRVEMQTM
jgi:hypothetical protein